MSLSVFIFALFGALLDFQLERPVFLREQANQLYSVTPYYLAKSLIDMPVLILTPLLQLSIVYWVIGYQSGYERFGMVYLALMLTAQAGAGIGLMISALSSNINQVTAIAFSVTMPLNLFGGFMVNPKTTFVWLSWIQWISPIRYCFACFCIAEWGNTPNKFVYEVVLGFGTRVGYWDCIIALALLALGFRIISIIGLKLNIQKFQ